MTDPIPFVRQSTRDLSYRDEQIVLYWRRGESAAGIARALGHTVEVVDRAMQLADALGVDMRRGTERRG